MEWNEIKRAYDIDDDVKDGETAVWPINENVEKCWQRGLETISEELSKYKVRRNSEIRIDFKSYMDMKAMPKTWWDQKKYASSNYAPKILKELFGFKNFDYAKSLYLVKDGIRVTKCSDVCLDYFAGSGTTGHAILDLNREDGGTRKYILIEVEHYFDDVILSRMKKVVYSPDWKDGHPTSQNGMSQFFKYIRLESYEDTLDALELNKNTPQQKFDDYVMKYAIKHETSDSPSLAKMPFDEPFKYGMMTLRNGSRSKVGVDLPETFNYLIGMQVHTRQFLDGVLAIKGTNDDKKRVLILWRGVENGDLIKWFKKHQKVSGGCDIIYVNGDHTLNTLGTNKGWIAHSIEPLFHQKMFEQNAAK